MSDRIPSFPAAVSQAAGRIRQLTQSGIRETALDRLELAARMLGGDRRRAARMPVRKHASISIDGDRHCSATIDIGEHGMMLDRPAFMTDARMGIGPMPAQVTVDQLGMLETELVGWTRRTLSFRLVTRQDDATAGRQAAMIGALQRESVRDISRSRHFAASIAFAFTRAVNQRSVSFAQLCALKLPMVKGSDPAQYEHPAQHWFDANMPDILARHFRPDMAYAVAADRNGFVPVHQPLFSQPQRSGDILFNHSFARNRRVYDDRWTLASARFAMKPMVQARQRDMPHGLGALVRNVSAPIRVMGRHWGAAQIGSIMDEPA